MGLTETCLEESHLQRGQPFFFSVTRVVQTQTIGLKNGYFCVCSFVHKLQ